MTNIKFYENIIVQKHDHYSGSCISAWNHYGNPFFGIGFGVAWDIHKTGTGLYIVIGTLR